MHACCRYFIQSSSPIPGQGSGKAASHACSSAAHDEIVLLPTQYKVNRSSTVNAPFSRSSYTKTTRVRVRKKTRRTSILVHQLPSGLVFATPSMCNRPHTICAPAHLIATCEEADSEAAAAAHSTPQLLSSHQPMQSSRSQKGVSITQGHPSWVPYTPCYCRTQQRTQRPELSVGTSHLVTAGGWLVELE
jgi:hypothetical protein